MILNKEYVDNSVAQQRDCSTSITYANSLPENYVQPKTTLTTNTAIYKPGNFTVDPPFYSSYTYPSTGLITWVSSFTIDSIINARYKCKNLPHPCMAFFLEIYAMNPICAGFYNGDHVVVKYKDYWFDINGEVSDISSYKPLSEYGLNYFINSFYQLDKNQLKTLIDAL